MNFYIIGFFISINLITFIAYAKDKIAAENSNWRTPEVNLHLLALIGGSIGALISCYVLRHKIRKDGFMDMLYIILALQIILIGGTISGFIPSQIANLINK